MTKEKSHMLMALAGNSIFGFSFLFSKLALNVAEPFVLLAIRFLGAFALMTVLRFLKIMQCDLKGKDLRPLILLGLLQPVIYFICESYGIKYTASSFAGIIIALCPIAGIFLGTVILRERPSGLQIFFCVLSVAGVIVMTVLNGVEGFRWKGFFFLLGAVFSGSMFSVYSRRISDRFTAVERTYVMFGVGTVVFAVLAILRVGTQWELWLRPMRSGSFWMGIVYLSFASSVGAFLLLNKALDVLDVARSLVFANVTTVISVLAGVLLLKEQFSPLQAVGIGMVLVGVYGANRFPEK